VFWEVALQMPFIKEWYELKARTSEGNVGFECPHEKNRLKTDSFLSITPSVKNLQ